MKAWIAFNVLPAIPFNGYKPTACLAANIETAMKIADYMEEKFILRQITLINQIRLIPKNELN